MTLYVIDVTASTHIEGDGRPIRVLRFRIGLFSFAIRLNEAALVRWARLLFDLGPATGHAELHGCLTLPVPKGVRVLTEETLNVRRVEV